MQTGREEISFGHWLPTRPVIFGLLAHINCKLWFALAPDALFDILFYFHSSFRYFRLSMSCFSTFRLLIYFPWPAPQLVLHGSLIVLVVVLCMEHGSFAECTSCSFLFLFLFVAIAVVWFLIGLHCGWCVDCVLQVHHQLWLRALWASLCDALFHKQYSTQVRVIWVVVEFYGSVAIPADVCDQERWHGIDGKSKTSLLVAHCSSDSTRQLSHGFSERAFSHHASVHLAGKQIACGKSQE